MAKPTNSGIGAGGAAGVATGAGGGSTPASPLSMASKADILFVVPLYNQMYDNGEMSQAQYDKALEELADLHNTDVGTVKQLLKEDGTEIKEGAPAKKSKSDQNNVQALASNLSKASQANVDKLNSASGLAEYPDKSSAHISWGSADDIQDSLGVSHSYASSMYSAIKSYTGSGYFDMRDAFKKAQTDGVSSLGSYEKGEYNKAKKLENFLAKGVKSGNEWNGGVTYRGVPFDSVTYDKIMNAKVGEYVDPNWGAPASWSTKIGKSRNFSGSTKGSSVIFCEVTGNHKGAVSVRGLSQYYSEAEVLASSKTQYRKVGQKMEGNILLVYVESE